VKLLFNTLALARRAVICGSLVDRGTQCQRLPSMSSASEGPFPPPAYVNGREGVVCEVDPACIERWKARLDDGTFVSVKAGNFVHICHGRKPACMSGLS